MFFRNGAMHLEVFLPGANVKPFALVRDDAANLAALANPFRQNGNVRDVPAGRDSLEDRARPDTNAGEIITALVTIPLHHVHDPIALERHVAPVIGLAQRERDVISGAEMFFDQWSEFDIRQQIAAVRDEMLVAQQRLDILDSAASAEDFRLVHQLHRMALIALSREQFLKSRRAMVRIDDERFHAGFEEMVEHESDQRLLENRDERLGQVLGERPEPRAKAGAEHECLRDHKCAALVLRQQSGKTLAMTEETIWRGTPSQLKNLGFFILCFLLCWLIVPIVLGIKRYLETKNHIFELTSERLKTTVGIFSKVTETLELYRVKDIEVLQPFWYRIFGLENIKVNTSDLSSPVIFLEGIPQNVGLPDKLRNQVETIRMQKKVREIDIE